MRLEHHQCIRQTKAVYGIVNALRKWWTRLRKDVENLAWKESTTESCLWCLRDSAGRLRGLAAAHVDDFMIAVNTESDVAMDALEQLHQAYERRNWETQDFVQCGTNIRQEYDGRSTT